jgi:hypothetical protein
MYRQLKPNYEGQELFYVKKLSDNSVIPFDPANTDYQAYLKWVAEGNTPEPAEGTE